MANANENLLRLYIPLDNVKLYVLYSKPLMNLRVTTERPSIPTLELNHFLFYDPHFPDEFQAPNIGIQHLKGYMFFLFKGKTKMITETHKNVLILR